MDQLQQLGISEQVGRLILGFENTKFYYYFLLLFDIFSRNFQWIVSQDKNRSIIRVCIFNNNKK
jgi:hypothetical protein